jgi:hypothetical protein
VTGRLGTVRARTTMRVTSMAWAMPELAARKKIDVTAAEPIAGASCWIELNEPLALPASSGSASPRATVGIAASLRPMPTPMTKYAGASAQRLTFVPERSTRARTQPPPARSSVRPMKTSRRPGLAARPPMAANPAATSPGVSGSRASEVSFGLMCSPSCKNRDSSKSRPAPAATATRHTCNPEVKPRFFMSEGVTSGWAAAR